MFAGCFASAAGKRLLRVYVNGQLSDILRKNCEAIALQFGEAPRTLQRFLESIKWNEEELRDRCQEIIARDHAHEEAIGTIDESGTAKVVLIPPVSVVNTMAIVARLRTVRLVFTWVTQRLDFKPSSTVVSICPRIGPMMRSVGNRTTYRTKLSFKRSRKSRWT